MRKLKLNTLTKKLHGRFDEVQATLDQIAESAARLNRECAGIVENDVGWMRTSGVPRDAVNL